MKYDKYPIGYVRIKNSGKGQLWFGNCERCGKPCAMHYKQQRRQGAGWLNAGFGHIECLRNGDWENAPVDDEVGDYD